jgi:CubicO group peptidase (beta-lactamase class C family)
MTRHPCGTRLLAMMVMVCTTLGVLAIAPASGQSVKASNTDAGPKFRPDGPDADAYGRKEGYPSCTGLTYIRDLRCRVGAFSNFGTLFPSRAIRASTTASPLTRSAGEPQITYMFEGRTLMLQDYLDRHPITGFLIAKGDSILIERYQYGRKDTDRLTSFSMAKTIVGLLIGIALKEGALRSIDDLAEAYVPGLKDSEYGRTPIKALLQMASGVAFNEDYLDSSSDIYTLARFTLEQDPAGGLTAVRRFNTRRAPPSQVFSYSSAESEVLGLVLAAATGRSVSAYASEKLWQPLGAEADAAWNIDATGQEVTFAYFNAVLRDWARLGLMLAHQGTWSGKAIVPKEWVLTSTTPQPDSPSPTYGYHVWLAEGGRFSLRGLRGQFVLVDPASKLVLVQTALSSPDIIELTVLWKAVRAATQ